MSIDYQKAYYLLSVADTKQLPPDTGIEIAIVGRSNAGKSSILNKITKQKQLARVSKTPGRTQLINIFVLDAERRLIDLPGYGYAKVPVAAKARWQALIDRYLSMRNSLKGMLLIMDIRHPLKELDLQLLAYCQAKKLPVHILLNKSDKLSKGAAAKVMHAVKATLTPYANSVTLQGFSALTGAGLKELYAQLDKWYGHHKHIEE